MAKTALLTVGSTQFSPLVAAFLSREVISNLDSHLGITTVQAQIGESALPQGWQLGRQTIDRVEVDVYRFAWDLEAKVGEADLVVSHAGAGSILSFLRPLNSTSAKPPRPLCSARQLILVPNSTLMDSHQSDLADELEQKGWAIVCRNPAHLCTTIKALPNHARDEQAPAGSRQEYPPLDKARVQRILDDTLGYA
ncbi:hypothetical protein JCM10212_000316 [Sporobolomyces blumeae]